MNLFYSVNALVKTTSFRLTRLQADVNHSQVICSIISSQKFWIINQAIAYNIELIEKA